MSVTQMLRERYPKAEIHWVTRKDMGGMLHTDPHIDKLWEFDRKKGFKGLIALGNLLKKEKFDLIYDAHNNLRSLVLEWQLANPILRVFSKNPSFVRRRKERIKRFLYFKFGIKGALHFPFKGMHSFQKPLNSVQPSTVDPSQKEWIFPESVPSRVDSEILGSMSFDEKVITLVPSAAWELKRWPVKYWKELVKLLPDYRFVILAGPGDDFCEEIRKIDTQRVINLAGKTSLIESFYVVYRSNLVISADTGFLHAADLFGKPGIALIGPTAFGHPTGASIKIMEVPLPCRPCTKEGNAVCKLKEVRKCLMDLTPEMVAEVVHQKLSKDSNTEKRR